MGELLHELDVSSDRGPIACDNSATHCCGERLNHLVMILPFKTDWHWSYGIRHPAQQQADYG